MAHMEPYYNNQAILFLNEQELAVIRDLIRDADDVPPHWFGSADIATVADLNQTLNPE